MNKTVRPTVLARPQGQDRVCWRGSARELGSTISYRTLEPRIAFDAALVATVNEIAGKSRADAGRCSTAEAQSAELHSQLVQALDATAPVGGDARQLQEQLSEALQAGGLNDSGSADARTMADAVNGNLGSHDDGHVSIVFIDGRVEEIETLLSGIDTNAEVYVLDPQQDGVAQIADVLEGRSGIDSIHILSHGSAGRLYLGDTTLDARSMQGGHAGELATLAGHSRRTPTF